MDLLCTFVKKDGFFILSMYNYGIVVKGSTLAHCKQYANILYRCLVLDIDDLRCKIHYKKEMVIHKSLVFFDAMSILSYELIYKWKLSDNQVSDLLKGYSKFKDELDYSFLESCYLLTSNVRAVKLNMDTVFVKEYIGNLILNGYVSIDKKNSTYLYYGYDGLLSMYMDYICDLGIGEYMKSKDDICYKFSQENLRFVSSLTCTVEHSLDFDIS